MKSEKKPKFKITIFATQVRPMYENFKKVNRAIKELKEETSKIDCWYFVFSKPKIERVMEK